MICFKCDHPIKPEEEKSMYGVEIPYVNLWFHRECWNSVKHDINKYMLENIKKIYEFTKNSNNNTKK